MSLVGVWLELEEPEEPWEEPEELQELREVPGEPEELQVLVKLFVLELAYPADSEVDGSERRTAARISERRGQQESPIWHSLLLLIPC